VTTAEQVSHLDEAQHLMRQIERHEEQIKALREARDNALRRAFRDGVKPGAMSRRLGLSPSAIRLVCIPFGTPIPPTDEQPVAQAVEPY
jgi:hypothetical protein